MNHNQILPLRTTLSVFWVFFFHITPQPYIHMVYSGLSAFALVAYTGFPTLNVMQTKYE